MQSALWLALSAAALAALSGLPSRLQGGRARGEGMAAALAAVAGVLGLAASLLVLCGGESARASLPWAVPGGSLTLELDGLAALFLIPVSLIPALASGYGLGYFHPTAEQGARLRLFQGLLTAGMVLLLLARNGVLFLVGWETMALAAFFLVATEHRQPAAQKAAWIYLVATHAGTACLIAAFALLPGAGAGLDWDPAAIAALPRGSAVLVFLLVLAGFGLKAGVMPLHVWLPAAHASAPSHVSAVLSGVMIKMGAYGVLRMLFLLPALPGWCAALVLLLGTVTALLGIAAALGQGDLKRMLAYSSIENIGIVFLGIGLGMLGRAHGEVRWQVLGFGGALLHVLNHSLFKPLLFFAAGALIHATGSRRMDLMGGLLRAMPRTALCFLVGAVAISGLPPLNGFAGELLLYLGLFGAASGSDTASVLLALLGLAGLCMTGALAVAAFVRAFTAVFLGAPRSAAAAHAHDAAPSMAAAMAALAVLCVLVGVLPWAVAPAVDRALAGSVVPLPPLASTAPLAALSAIGCAVLALGATLFLFLWRARAAAPRAGTWDCGYAAPGSSRIQYTAASFGQFLVELLGRTAGTRATGLPHLDLLPGHAHFRQEEREPLLHGVLMPWFHRQAERCRRLRVLQAGRTQIYLLYILLITALLLGWSAMTEWLRS